MAAAWLYKSTVFFFSLLPTYSAAVIADFVMVRRLSNKGNLSVGLNDLLGEAFRT